jgi:hypothetical protein
LYTGDREHAIPLLEKAEEIIASKDSDGRVTPAEIRQLVVQAQHSTQIPGSETALRVPVTELGRGPLLLIDWWTATLQHKGGLLLVGSARNAARILLPCPHPPR